MVSGFRPKITVISAAVFLAAGLFFAVAARPARAATDGGNVTGWMWSSDIGWISMNCSNFGTCALSTYGVDLQDVPTGGGPATRATLSGYAWSDNFGWICFGQTCTGENPEHIANYAEWRVGAAVTPTKACAVPADCGPLETCNSDAQCSDLGRIYGWAKVLSLGSGGWISLNCNNDVNKSCGTSNYFVVFDRGKFTLSEPWPPAAGPDPNNYHWGWSGNDEGTGPGWIDTSLVFADWAPSSLGAASRPEGVYEPDRPSLPEEEKRLHYPSKLSITVRNVSCPSHYRLECVLELPNGAKRVIGRDLGDTAYYGGAADKVTFDYVVTQADAASGGIQQDKLWYIDGCQLEGKPLADQPCASDSDCSSGRACDEEAVIGGQPGTGYCRRVMVTTPKKPVYVHATHWTLFNNNEDYYQAIKCYAGFPGQYFNNAGRCDFTGDASFSLALSRGLPLKRDCHGLPDGGGTTDCGDRFCSGSSYFCADQQPIRCVWDEASGAIPKCSDLDYERGGLCCTRQPVEAGSQFSSVVNGLECRYRDPNDGYFDCDCDSAKFGQGDCYAPGYQPGDLCCTARGEVSIGE